MWHFLFKSRISTILIVYDIDAISNTNRHSWFQFYFIQVWTKSIMIFFYHGNPTLSLWFIFGVMFLFCFLYLYKCSTVWICTISNFACKLILWFVRIRNYFKVLPKKNRTWGLQTHATAAFTLMYEMKM